MTTQEHPGVEQLLACLDVLWQKLQYLIADSEEEQGKAPDLDEWVTALWQTIELVYAMAQELEYVHSLVEAYTSEEAQQRSKVQAVIGGLVGPDGKPIKGVTR